MIGLSGRALSLMFVSVAGCGLECNVSQTPRMSVRMERRIHKRLASEAYDEKKWLKCADLYRMADDSYNAACCYAQAGNADAAFVQLLLAAQQGRIPPGQPLNDVNLVSLRSDARWENAIARFVESAAAFRKANNEELLSLFEQDQADRHSTNIDWTIVGSKDEKRRMEVQKLLEEGRVSTSVDYFHAAMIFQHGTHVTEIQNAYELALKAVELDVNNDQARWLVAAATDRKLMQQNLPQKYGTQYVTHGAQPWALWPVDGLITDEERDKWNVPSLAEAQKEIARMNRSGAPANSN